MDSLTIRANLREWINKLKSSKFKSDVISECLMEINKCKPSCRDHHEQFSALFEQIIINADLDWISSSYSEALMIDAFQNLTEDLKILSLVSLLYRFEAGARLEFVISLLQRLFCNGSYRNLIVQESVVSTTASSCLWSKLVSCIASLPDHVANKFKTSKSSSLFHYERFFIFLGVEIAESIELLTEKVKQSHDVNTEFLSLNIGQFCVLGKADHLFKALYPKMIFQTRSDFLWRRILQKCFLTITDRHMDSVLSFVFKETLVLHSLPRILGDLVIKNTKAKYIILHKLLLTRYFSKPTTAENVIGYIANSAASEHLLIEILQKLVGVWSNTSAIKHTSYQQHRYITAAILICVCYLSKNLDEKEKDKLLTSLMDGMKNHLESPDEKIRRLGMIVGEKLSSIMKVKSEKDTKLEFEYVHDNETAMLLSLCEPPTEPGDDYYESLKTTYRKMKKEIEFKDDSAAIEETTFSTAKSTFMKMAKANNIQLPADGATEEKHISTEIQVDDASVDSDDDLVPYDIPEEVPISKTSRPMYVRDCLEGLINHKEREEMEIYINSVSRLVETDASEAKEVAVELFKVLLALQDNYSIENFHHLRRTALAAVLVCNPKPVAEYVTAEFYTEQYNLQQRMDMLDVLVMAAGRLSELERKVKIKPETAAIIDQATKGDSESLTWQQIVEKRIEAKTRRWGKARKPVYESTPDRFGPVAGCFFYPLMSGYDRRIRTLDLLGQDSIILGRLLYALGTIMYSAANSTVSERMGNSLLEFVEQLRDHVEPFVRKACIYCISMVTVSVPFLTEVLSSAILETREWLCVVMVRDDDIQTREAAANALGLMDTKARRELGMGKT